MGGSSSPIHGASRATGRLSRAVGLLQRRAGPLALAAIVCLLLLESPTPQASADPLLLRAQPEKGQLRIELRKAGLLRVFGDDHLIRVNDYRCDVQLDELDLTRSSVKIVIPAASLEVLDPELAADKREEVQKRMEGPDVLDISRFPEITFVSREVERAGDGKYRVEGDLTVRDVTRPFELEVSLLPEGDDFRAQGEVRFRQSSFGIRPVSAVGGTIKVKDEMKMAFDLVLEPTEP